MTVTIIYIDMETVRAVHGEDVVHIRPATVEMDMEIVSSTQRGCQFTHGCRLLDYGEGVEIRQASRIGVAE
jgi:hypothetical protein